MALKKKSFSFFAASVIILVSLSGCPAPVITTSMLVPAASDEAAKLKKVAVLPFDGPEGKEFVAQIEAVLAGVKFEKRQYFELVDRMTIDKVLAEHRFSQLGLVDPQTAAKIGNFIGAKGIYVGTITASDVSDTDFREKRTRCAYYVTAYDKKGSSYQKCARWDDYFVPCTKRTSTSEFVPKLVDVETSRIVYSNTLSGKAESASCSDSSTALASKADLKMKAQQEALMKLRRDVAPHYLAVVLKLMDSTDGITTADAKKSFKSGMDFARNNRLDRACELWGEAKAAALQSPSVLFNLGICAEVTGRLEEALSLYNEADRKLNKPDDRITSALTRVKTAIEKQKTLKDQLAQ